MYIYLKVVQRHFWVVLECEDYFDPKIFEKK